MTTDQARNQLCKMMGEVAGGLGVARKTQCVCTGLRRVTTVDDVPDEVIEELWRRVSGYNHLADLLKETAGSYLDRRRDRGLLDKIREAGVEIDG